ncbi:MAG TPA: 50S ribosomal protein L13 [Bacteroidia bacterium]|nr:50S ribosomal protein L13 [Bacteroidia bacterium]HNT80511.1 50S ribosomal protein L13 [Bacteroidia bacterium]
MKQLTYKTLSANAATIDKKWILIDAEDQIVGRLSTMAAKILRGKHKASFTPHVNCGDNVIIINAEKVKFSGNKFQEKQYVSYTGYPGGQRFINPSNVMSKKPTFVVENAIRGMLPKNRLGRDIFRNLHVFAGSEHPHEAQKPTKLEL